MIKKYVMILTAVIVCLSTLVFALPEPYKSIQVLPPDMHGWFREENQKNLKQFIEKYQPTVVVELGSWLGSSAFYMAKLMKKDSFLYAVDNWTAEGDTSILNDQDSAVKKRIPTLYQQFLSNVIHMNLTDKIIPVRMKTVEAAQSLNIKVDLIYIDASHDEESVFNDIMSWYPKLKKGGMMCGDDAFFSGVRKAVERTSEILNTRLHIDGNFWYFEPT